MKQDYHEHKRVTNAGTQNIAVKGLTQANYLLLSSYPYVSKKLFEISRILLLLSY